MALGAEQVAFIGQVFESYVLQHHRDELLAILRERDAEAHYAVVVDALTLFETNMEIGEYFNAFPARVLPIFDSALRRAALTALQAAEPAPGLCVKTNLHARISGECGCRPVTASFCGKSCSPNRRSVSGYFSCQPEGLTKISFRGKSVPPSFSC
uniref:MCM9 N-terminal domain-containing protein n=1 Tax=Anas zonorhyncha TaxID=75864 RepID=A0A8B9UYM6_9AVES